MVSSVNSHSNATRIGWHLWESDFRFSPGLPPGWRHRANLTCRERRVRVVVGSALAVVVPGRGGCRMEVHVVRGRVATSSSVSHLAGVLGTCLDGGVDAVVGQMRWKGGHGSGVGRHNCARLHGPRPAHDAVVRPPTTFVSKNATAAPHRDVISGSAGSRGCRPTDLVASRGYAELKKRLCKTAAAFGQRGKARLPGAVAVGRQQSPRRWLRQPSRHRGFRAFLQSRKMDRQDRAGHILRVMSPVFLQKGQNKFQCPPMVGV